MTQDHYFLLMLALLGFGGQIGVQVVISMFQAYTEKKLQKTLSATHDIVNSQRTEMIDKIERMEILLRDKEALRAILNSIK